LLKSMKECFEGSNNLNIVKALSRFLVRINQK
jgi:hypothetical protein